MVPSLLGSTEPAVLVKLSYIGAAEVRSVGELCLKRQRLSFPALQKLSHLISNVCQVSYFCGTT
ncbi:hypothetical protein CHELA1G11_11869 [Hyphomicrobiales bacterium]|nr:hypothetical protein CHELA1G11_11869 [Hyphomicrobiales bacterium]CAH1664889.1 hypothetical protein CHELA1G2_12440 [Hyphomicrobiales bacterium]